MNASIAAGPPKRISFALRGLWWSARSAFRVSRAGRSHAGPLRLAYVFDYGPAPVSELESGVEFRELSDSDSVPLGAIVQAVDSSTNDHTLETGSVVGSIQGTVVYRAWYVRAEPDRVQGAPKSWVATGRVLFLHGGTTEPGYRGRGIHSAATRWLLAHEGGRGVVHAMCFVHADNFPARRTVERAGFRLLGAVDE